MSNSKKVFLLGVGCQKGGTTWLHGQLAKHPEVDLGFTKEYHIFDALHIDDMKYFAQQKLNKLQHPLFSKLSLISWNTSLGSAEYDGVMSPTILVCSFFPQR